MSGPRLPVPGVPHHHHGHGGQLRVPGPGPCAGVRLLRPLPRLPAQTLAPTSRAALTALTPE